MLLSETVRALRWSVGGVYAIRCTSSGLVYVGGTRSIRNRIRHHRERLSKGTHNNPKMQADWDRHGSDSFSADSLETMTDARPESIHSLENLWMDSLRSTGHELFNISPRAESRIGATLSDEQRRRIGNVQLGKRASEETRQKMSEAHRGNTYSVGYKQTEEHVRKKHTFTPGFAPSEEHLRAQTEGRRRRRKTYVLISPEGNVVTVLGLREFCLQHDLSVGCIGNLISGRARTHRGWTFKEAVQQ